MNSTMRQKKPKQEPKKKKNLTSYNHESYLHFNYYSKHSTLKLPGKNAWSITH